MAMEKIMNEEEELKSQDKAYKIVYTVNLLGTIKPHGEESLVDVLKEKNNSIKEL